MTQALRVSCNTAFANLGLEVGEDKLREQSTRFGFNQRHLPELGGAASRFPDEIDDAQLALSAIGQYDVAASPLQMAMVSAAIANDGVLMDPYLVSMVQAPDLKPLETHKPEVLSTAAHPGARRRAAGDDGRRGRQRHRPQRPDQRRRGRRQDRTAQSDPKRKPFAWFTSFAPLDDPKVAVAVIVEDADIPRDDIAGGRVAAPIAKAVMEAVLGE